MRDDVLNLDQVKSIAEPARSELATALLERGPMTVSSLSEATGRRPKVLYHHLRVLIEAGLVRVAGSQKKGRHDELVYELSSKSLELRLEGASEEYLDAAERQVRIGLAAMERAYSRMFRSRRFDAATYSFDGARLTEEDVELLRAKVAELRGWIRQRSRPDGDRILVMLGLVPEIRSTGVRK